MNAMASWLRWYRKQRGAAREGSAFLLCLLTGSLIVPAAIYLVGIGLLGPYTGGGLGTYLADFWRQLFKLAPAFWLVALGPYLALWLLRLARRLPLR
jgi:hypothetical protein